MKLFTADIWDEENGCFVYGVSVYKASDVTARIAEAEKALRRIAQYPHTRADELGYEGCRAVANKALGL